MSPGALPSYARDGMRKHMMLGLFLMAVGCGPGAEGDDMSCLDPLPLDCRPGFPPTYDQIFDQVLSVSCGAQGNSGACHGTAGAKGDLVLAERDQAHAYLLGEMGARARIIPGEPECSLLVQRLESEDASFRMPLGTQPLSEGQLCAIRQWIANGAERE